MADCNVVVPDWGLGNPYLRLLESGLSGIGVRVSWASVARHRRMSLLRTVRRARSSVLHVQWQHPFFLGESRFWRLANTACFWAQVAFLKRQGVRLVWTIHNPVNHEHTAASWERVQSTRLGRLADAIIVHSAGVKQEVVTSFAVDPRKVSVIPHGHYADWYGPPRERRAARRNLGLPDGAKVLISFGLVRPYKGLEALIDAVRASSDPDLTAIIAGSPHDREYAAALEERARGEPRIRLILERLPDEALVSWVSAADAVVVPYRSVTTSGVAIAACSLRRACIAPGMGSFLELPEDGRFLYDPSLPGALTRAIDAVSREDLLEAGSAAMRWVLRYDWRSIADATARVYRGLPAAWAPSEQGGGS